MGCYTNNAAYEIFGNQWVPEDLPVERVSSMALSAIEMTRRKGTVKGRETRNQSLNTKLTPSEAAAVEAASMAQGKTVGEWMRDVALHELLSGESQVPSLAVLTEIAALRLLLINTLELMLRGEKMTPEQFKEMLRYVKTNKRKAAADMLASYAEGTTEQL